jgi:hypothetical protein
VYSARQGFNSELARETVRYAPELEEQSQSRSIVEQNGVHNLSGIELLIYMVERNRDWSTYVTCYLY